MSNSCHSHWIAIPSICGPRLPEWVAAWQANGWAVALYVDLGNRTRATADRVMEGRYTGYGAACNALAALLFGIEHADLVAFGGDDVWPDPAWPAARLAARFAARFPGLDGIAQPGGGNMHDLDRCCIAPLVGAGWYARRHGPYCAEYFHFWCDTELHDLADNDGKLEVWRDVNWTHDHWAVMGRPPPDHIAKARALNEQDHQLYLKRKAAGFPPPGA